MRVKRDLRDGVRLHEGGEDGHDKDGDRIDEEAGDRGGKRKRAPELSEDKSAGSEVKHEIAVSHEVKEERNVVEHDLDGERIGGPEDVVKVMSPKVVSDITEDRNPDVCL